MCNLKDVQVESPQGNEENAYACPSYHGVFALLVKPLQHTFHRLAPTDFHGAGLSGIASTADWEGAKAGERARKTGGLDDGACFRLCLVCFSCHG